MNTYIEIAYEGNNADKEQVKAFNKSTYIITDVFDRQANLKLTGVRKILIELQDEAQYQVFPPSKVSPMILIRAPFNFAQYLAKDKYSRRGFILDTLYKAIEQMCSKLNYDLQPFHEAYEQVKALNYQNAYIHGKLKSAPDRTHKAGVHIRVEEEHAVLSALVQDSEGNETTRIEILRTLPHYMFIYKFIHQTKWLDKDRFQISDKSGQVVFEVNVQEQKAAMHLQPKNLSLPELVQEVAQAMADKSL